MDGRAWRRACICEGEGEWAWLMLLWFFYFLYFFGLWSPLLFLLPSTILHALDHQNPTLSLSLSLKVKKKKRKRIREVNHKVICAFSSTIFAGSDEICGSCTETEVPYALASAMGTSPVEFACPGTIVWTVAWAERHRHRGRSFSAPPRCNHSQWWEWAHSTIPYPSCLLNNEMT